MNPIYHLKQWGQVEDGYMVYFFATDSLARVISNI